MIILFEGKLDVILYAWNDDAVITWIKDIENNIVCLEDNLSFPDKFFAYSLPDVQKSYNEVKEKMYIDKINEKYLLERGVIL